jgi:DNA-binding IclR family transcriptional regulator
VSADGVGTPRRSGIQVIARAADLLRALEHAGGGMSLSQLAQAIDLPRSTVHRIALALEREGFVMWSAHGLIRLGPALAPLARASQWSLGDIARPYIAMLSLELNETVELSVLQGSGALLVDQAVAHNRLRAVSTVGARFPAHCTANGKALLATLPDAEVKRLLGEGLERFTAHTVTRRRDLLDELAAVRESRLAYDREEYTDGIAGIAVAVRDRHGDAASVAVPVPIQRFAGRAGALAAALLAAADELEAALQKT